MPTMLAFEQSIVHFKVHMLIFHSHNSSLSCLMFRAGAYKSPRCDNCVEILLISLIINSVLQSLSYTMHTRVYFYLSPNYVATEPSNLSWVSVHYICTATHPCTWPGRTRLSFAFYFYFCTMLLQNLSALSRCPCITSAQPPFYALTTLYLVIAVKLLQQNVAALYGCPCITSA